MSDEQDIYDSRQYKALVKLIGDKDAAEFCKRDDASLKTVISGKTVERQKVLDERDENSAYRKACEEKAAFDAAARETIKPMQVHMNMATKLLRARK